MTPKEVHDLFNRTQKALEQLSNVPLNEPNRNAFVFMARKVDKLHHDYTDALWMEDKVNDPA